MTPDELLKALKANLPQHFVIADYLRAGGQGAVFRGTCNGVDAVLKAFHATSDPRRVKRELELLKKVVHPNLVRLVDNCDVTIGGDDISCIAYEYHGGGDLRASLAANGPMPAATAEKLLEQMLFVIEALWSERIVHRDIKPDNIVIRGPDDFVLVDVGLAYQLDLSGLTAAGFAPGTRTYMSPEQASGRKTLTSRSDVFALGVTVYEMVTGTHPFGNRQPDLLRPVPAPDIVPLKAVLPESTANLIMKMLTLKTTDRPGVPIVFP